MPQKLIALLLAAVAGGAANAETIRVAIGTQDTTINCATGGLLIRELKLLEKYLPRDGKYKDCLLYTSPSPRDGLLSRMPSSA